MKHHILPITLLCFILVSCALSEPITIHKETKEDTFLSRTETSLLLSCDPLNIDKILKNIQELPKNSITTTIDIDPDCQDKRIPDILMKTLTQKSLYLVHWFPVFPVTEKTVTVYYKFTDDEIHSIAKSPWKWLAITNLTPAQYRILRNEKTSIREGFEPNGSSDYYTKEEQVKCDRFQESYTGSDENMQMLSLDKTVDCYKNLPPLL